MALLLLFLEMEFRDERTIYLIPPRELLSNVKKAFEKTGMNILERESGELSWNLYGKRSGLVVEASLKSKMRKIDELAPFGEIFITFLKIRAIGDESLIKKFKWNLETSLLRCLG
ncbi:hypothetical protein DRN86_03020 [Candidatus Geothermarchaeota archaeon]|nr:MAG: hypothetical protein DRN86_03020 [Candidatus Geothermarchaeota archaeon]